MLKSPNSKLKTKVTSTASSSKASTGYQIVNEPFGEPSNTSSPPDQDQSKDSVNESDVEVLCIDSNTEDEESVDNPRSASTPKSALKRPKTAKGSATEAKKAKQEERKVGFSIDKLLTESRAKFSRIASDSSDSDSDEEVSRLMGLLSRSEDTPSKEGGSEAGPGGPRPDQNPEPDQD